MSAADDQRVTTAPVLGGVTPYLTIDGAETAAAFYKRAFDAQEVGRAQPDAQGRLMNIHLYINGGSLMMSDPFPEHGHPALPPQAFGLHLEVDDIRLWWDRAVAAGAEVLMPVQPMFWGDDYGQLRDPFGITWSIGSPIRRSP